MTKMKEIGAKKPLVFNVSQQNIRDGVSCDGDHCILANGLNSHPDIMKAKVWRNVAKVVFIDKPNVIVKYRLGPSAKDIPATFDTSPKALKALAKAAPDSGFRCELLPPSPSQMPGAKRGKTGTDKRSGAKPGSRTLSTRKVSRVWS